MHSILLIVSGRVQNVGYRHFVYTCANSLSIKGYVCNLQDGSVEINAHGEDYKIAIFLEQLKVGPSAARVFDFQQSDIPFKEYTSFVIKR